MCLCVVLKICHIHLILVWITFILTPFVVLRDIRRFIGYQKMRNSEVMELAVYTHSLIYSPIYTSCPEYKWGSLSALLLTAVALCIDRFMH